MTSFKDLGIINDMPQGWSKGKNQPLWHKKVYTMWKDMWRRCRCENHSSYNYYKECLIYEPFRHLSNYVSWIIKQPRFNEFCNTCHFTRWNVDKDLKGDNKCYFPEYMCLIPQSENSRERNQRRGSIYKRKPCIGIKSDSVLLLKSLNDGELYGFNHTHISNCCKKRYKTHKKYKWYFINYTHNTRYRIKR